MKIQTEETGAAWRPRIKKDCVQFDTAVSCTAADQKNGNGRKQAASDQGIEHGGKRKIHGLFSFVF